MAKIFISHSKQDKELLEDTKEIFKETKVEYVIYDNEKGEQWKNIREYIRNSDAMFLLLGRDINPDHRERAYTHNWIAFEDGIACGCEPKKRLVVFHPAYDPQNNPNKYDENKYAIPYLTDYIYYDSNNSLSYDIALDIISFFDPNSKRVIREELLKLLDVTSKEYNNHITIYGNPEEDGIATYSGKIECRFCHLKFNLVSCNNVILCPACKEQIVL
ncbi:MAG TPA: hypothetical protein VIO11_09910 [Candidatus Methanoperedens sp.]